MAVPLIGGGILLAYAAGRIAFSVLAALGIGFVTFKGFGAAFDFAQDIIVDNLNATSAEVFAFLGAIQVDVVLTLIFSAIAAKIAFQAATAGFKKFVIR